MAVKKRKTKKKTAATKKKKAPARRRSRAKRIIYKCVLGRCTAIPKHAPIGKVGDMVEMEAKNTDVEIDFPRGSPFDTDHISIEEGETVTEEIVNSGEFEYDLSCTKCKRRLSGPPSMIVD